MAWLPGNLLNVQNVNTFESPEGQVDELQTGVGKLSQFFHPPVPVQSGCTSPHCLQSTLVIRHDLPWFPQ